MLWPLAACLIALQTPTADLERRVASIVPTAAEDRWLEIPWHVDLMSARAEAQRARRPLFLWTMNGHPLGTT